MPGRFCQTSQEDLHQARHRFLSPKISRFGALSKMQQCQGWRRRLKKCNSIRFRLFGRVQKCNSIRARLPGRVQNCKNIGDRLLGRVHKCNSIRDRLLWRVQKCNRIRDCLLGGVQKMQQYHRTGVSPPTARPMADREVTAPVTVASHHWVRSTPIKNEGGQVPAIRKPPRL